MLFGVNWVVIFQQEGLQLEELKKDIEKYGDITDIEFKSDEDLGDLCLIYIRGGFGKFVRFKLDFNCVVADDSPYILFPMENLEEKLKVESERR